MDRAAADEMVRVSGQRGVPVTVIDGRVVVGYDQQMLTQLLGSQRARLGAAVADAEQMATRGYCRATSGAYVGRLNEGGVAEQAGLRPGDVIISVGGRAVHNAAELETLMARLRPGLQVPVHYLRGDVELDTTLSL